MMFTGLTRPGRGVSQCPEDLPRSPQASQHPKSPQAAQRTALFINGLVLLGFFSPETKPWFLPLNMGETMLFTIKIMGGSSFNFPLNQSIDEQIPSWWDSEATSSEPWKDSWKYSFYVVCGTPKTLLSKSQFFTIPYYFQFQAAKLLKKRWKKHDMENLSEAPWKAVVPSNHPTLLPGKRGRVQLTPQNLRIAPERFLPVLPVEVLDAFMTLGSKWKNPKKCLDFRQKLLLTVTQSAEYVVCTVCLSFTRYPAGSLGGSEHLVFQMWSCICREYLVHLHLSSSPPIHLQVFLVSAPRPQAVWTRLPQKQTRAEAQRCP